MYVASTEREEVVTGVASIEREEAVTVVASIERKEVVTGIASIERGQRCSCFFFFLSSMLSEYKSMHFKLFFLSCGQLSPNFQTAYIAMPDATSLEKLAL